MKESGEPQSERHLARLLGKPKRAWHLRFVTSTFFLGIVSAVILAAGGTYFTTRNQCLREGQAAEYEHASLMIELGMRSSRYFIAAAGAKTPAELKRLIAEVIPELPAYRDKSLPELFVMLENIYRKVDPVLLKDKNLGNYRLEQIMHSIGANNRAPTADDLKRVQSVLAEEYKWAPYDEAEEAKRNAGDFVLVANCDPLAVVDQVLGGKNFVAKPQAVPKSSGTAPSGKSPPR